MNFRGVVKAFIPRKLFHKIEPWGHLAEAILFNVINRFPARGLKVIGVTGTNGKTSTCFLIHRMMVEAGCKVGLMTTVGWGVGRDIKPQVHHMTNVTVPELMQRLKQMKEQGAEWLVLETTSHALAQHRVWGIPYSVAVMTNVTHEHLDYHGTFERYRDAKRKLFRLVAKNRGGLQVGVYNADDPSAELFKSDVPKPIGYGLKKGGLRIKNVKLTPSGSDFELDGGIYRSDEVNGEIGQVWDGTSYMKDTISNTLHIHTNLPGSFNAMNSAAAAAVGLALELTSKQIEQGIAALESVEGRMTTIDEGQEFEVIVDYAHTPDSFEKLLSDMRKTINSSRTSHLDASQGSSEGRARHTKGTVSERLSVTDAAMRQEAASAAGRQSRAVRGHGKLIVMFGSAGGQRDKLKRPVQGELAGKYADEVILTEEDDRDTPGMEILEQIAVGAQKTGKVRDKDLFLIHDRAEAINFTLGRAKTGDTVLLLGKGHEKTIERADGEHPWDEIGIAKATLKDLNSK